MTSFLLNSILILLGVKETGGASRKRLLESSSEEDEHPPKKLRTADGMYWAESKYCLHMALPSFPVTMCVCVDKGGDSDDESAEDESLQAGPAVQQDVGGGAQPEAGDDSEGDGGDQDQPASLQQQEQEEDDDSDGVVDEGKCVTHVNKSVWNMSSPTFFVSGVAPLCPTLIR